MELIPEFLVSDAMFKSHIYITQDNEDNSKLYFELHHEDANKLYISLRMSSAENKEPDMVYHCIYDQYNHRVHAPLNYPDNPSEIIGECLEVIVQNKQAKRTTLTGIPFYGHDKKMKAKWFKEVMLETFGKVLHDGKVKGLAMTLV